MMGNTKIVLSYYGDYHEEIQNSQHLHDHQTQRRIKFVYHHSFACDVGFLNQVRCLFYPHYNFAFSIIGFMLKWLGNIFLPSCACLLEFLKVGESIVFFSINFFCFKVLSEGALTWNVSCKDCLMTSDVSLFIFWLFIGSGSTISWPTGFSFKSFYDSARYFFFWYYGLLFKSSLWTF